MDLKHPNLEETLAREPPLPLQPYVIACRHCGRTDSALYAVQPRPRACGRCGRPMHVYICTAMYILKPPP